jgi:RHS repeat-associated protein
VWTALDQPANLLGDTTVRAGNVTTENRYGTVTTRKYTGARLTSATVGTTTTSFWYDPLGNVDCVTLAAGSQANCSPSGTSGSANLVTDYTYDYLSRLSAQRSFAGGAQTDKADYTYDALDRTVSETEDHASTGKDRTTAFTYQGLSSLVTREEQSGGTNAKVKTYSYDAYGHRLSMSDQVKGSATPPEPFTYSHDVHGSVSQLISDAGSVRASYGYDAYGGQESPDSDAQSLTTGDPDNQTPLNPFRYSAKRMDSGTATSAGGAATLDMGARRFGPSTGRFQQPDVYFGALSNLGLSVDPLTQNRYALAGANPVSFMELDGHIAIPDGGGGAATSPTAESTTITSAAAEDPEVIESGDRREGRRIRNDDWGRNPEGGRGYNHWDTDWAGRGILARYLSGGGDWTIKNDPEWNKYMKDNALLRQQLGPRVQALAADLERKNRKTGVTGATFDDRFSAEIENGEGVVGYQYLHGTDATAGGFNVKGTASITGRRDGGHDVRIKADYTWNDWIDPNPIYETDRRKSTIAEIITLGRADPYRISITWSEETTVSLDASGNVISASGYPFS